MEKSDEQWQGESDAATLAEAEAIRDDGPRLENAKSAATDLVEAAKKTEEVVKDEADGQSSSPQTIESYTKG